MSSLGNSRIVFRTDASIQIGTGHVMRCLTLADELKARGAQCQFICREHSGHLLEVIRSRGHTASALVAETNDFRPVADNAQPLPAHAAWLGCDWQIDAEQCFHLLKEIQPNWLVMDHYALDARWQAVLKPHYGKLLVIDDLADRHHLCDVLLDQNLGRKAQDYADLIPQGCELLIGPRYALLRPDFTALREYSLARRERPQLQHLLVTMGGVDKDNVTGEVLDILKGSNLPLGARVTVVMGATAPWLACVKSKADDLPWPTEVLVNVNDMARLMAESDLAIGAAGSTSWERCCLGLPTLMMVLAENQQGLAKALEKEGAVYILENIGKNLPRLLSQIIEKPSILADMTQKACSISDGQGVSVATHRMGQ